MLRTNWTIIKHSTVDIYKTDIEVEQRDELAPKFQNIRAN
jgi:hypothetical protein